MKRKTADVSNKNEVFLEHKRMKRWTDNNNKSGAVCYMLYARALFITWGTREYWDWNCFKETGEENIEVAKLSHVCWLDVRGKLKMSELSPGIVYDVFYQVKLTKGGFGWELPVTLRLSLPDGRVQHRQVSLRQKPRGEWMELKVGNFQTQEGESREVCFDLYEHGGHWKSGLIVKGAILRPRNRV